MKNQKTVAQLRVELTKVKEEILKNLKHAIKLYIADHNPGGGQIIFEDEGMDVFEDEANNDIVGLTKTDVIFNNGDEKYPLGELGINDALELLYMLDEHTKGIF